MPLFTKKDEKQYTAGEINRTRLITEVRWVMESADSCIKQWRFFQNVVPNTMIEKISNNFEIVRALINCHRSVFVKDTSRDKEIADKILQLADETNKIEQYVEKLKDTNGIQSKRTDLKTTNSVDNSPKMSFDELQKLTLETYQLKQALSYCTEHLSEYGQFVVRATNQRQDLLQPQIQSRNRNTAKFDLYMQYNTKNVTGWYSKFPNLSRVAGYCAHIPSVTYYLPFARYNNPPTTPIVQILYIIN